MFVSMCLFLFLKIGFVNSRLTCPKGPLAMFKVVHGRHGVFFSWKTLLEYVAGTSAYLVTSNVRSSTMTGAAEPTEATPGPCRASTPRGSAFQPSNNSPPPQTNDLQRTSAAVRRLEPRLGDTSSPERCASWA